MVDDFLYFCELSTACGPAAFLVVLATNVSPAVWYMQLPGWAEAHGLWDPKGSDFMSLLNCFTESAFHIPRIRAIVV
jgi:hypothetical protein